MKTFPSRHVHILGIGGAGASGLARMLLERGVKVSGSDRTPSATTEQLIDCGADIRYKESGDNVSLSADLLVYSAAVKPEHPERVRAAELGLRQLKYSQALGLLTRERRTIAVCGTHGKTSTTCLIAALLNGAGLRPGWLVGGSPRSLPASARWTDGEYFVVEACEYDRSFLNLRPAAVVLHNIEPDHMDYFKTFDALKGAFSDFVAMLPPDGVVFANWDCEPVREIAERAQRRVVRYGLCGGATFGARDIRMDGGCARFELVELGQPVGEMELAMPGRVMVSNALAASSVALWAGVEPHLIARSLAETQSVRRRFELVGTVRGVPVVDDYAHHPTAVAAIAECARNAYPGRKLQFVFQAHQYARLLGFFDDFVKALAGVDEVLVCRTYAARESGVVPGEPEERLAKALRAKGVSALSLSNFDGVIRHVMAGLTPDKAIVVVGAGDVTDVAHRLVKAAPVASGRFEEARQRS